jgi:putative DNA methylase
MNKHDAQIERERLFEIIRKLVLWENTNNESVLEEARAEIWKSWKETCELNKNHPQAAELFNPEKLPAFHDPFAGGGALPLEAQRLGLESYASDLNPVAVLIGHLYPPVDLPAEYGGGKATVIAWLWARTVKSPNPAFSHVDVPLISTFILSSKAGKEAYIEPIIEGDSYRFEVRNGKPLESTHAGTTAGKRAAFICLLSKSPMDYNHIREEGKAGRMGQKLIAIVAEGVRGRVYLSPTSEAENTAKSAIPTWKPTTEMPKKHRNFQPPVYGMDTLGDIFTARQLVGLTTFSDLIQEVREKIKIDALKAGWLDDEKGLDANGQKATAYADAVAVYLALLVNQVANHSSSICGWNSANSQMRSVFSRQAIPMVWDYAESNIFCDSSGSFNNLFERQIKGFSALNNKIFGTANQLDAQTQSISVNRVISTDPPYYDNIAYADLSDFFYVWVRRSLRLIYPTLFATVAVPKSEELVAIQNRHGSKEKAEKFFLDGMTEAMRRLAEQSHPAFPTTIYYAFKQSDTTDVGTGNTGWETFLEAVMKAGFAITGTLPMRTEKEGRMIGNGANALASSIVLVCRKRDENAPTIPRRQFLRDLKQEMTQAMEVMIGGAEGISPVAPVDLAQAIIGPGMAIYSKYSAVLEADGSAMNVHTALTLINKMLVEGDDDFEADTQFCLSWFDEVGWSEGEFGKADVLTRAKGTSVQKVRDAGVVESSAGRVRLLKWTEYAKDWSPKNDHDTPIWEALHQLIREFNQNGEIATGALLAKMPSRAEAMRSLAYRLYTLCERKGWAEDARSYNELITAWTSIESASHDVGHVGTQMSLDL